MTISIVLACFVYSSLSGFVAARLWMELRDASGDFRYLVSCTQCSGLSLDEVGFLSRTVSREGRYRLF